MYMYLRACIYPYIYCSERPNMTAARECYEETLGVLGQTDHLLSLLENREGNNVFQVSRCELYMQLTLLVLRPSSTKACIQ